jgi:hypothetical protein
MSWSLITSNRRRRIDAKHCGCGRLHPPAGAINIGAVRETFDRATRLQGEASDDMCGGPHGGRTLHPEATKLIATMS